MICDWCGKKSRETLHDNKFFHVLDDYVYTPIICQKCYSELKKQKLSKLKLKNS
jgi:hypothetical protein